MFDILGGKIQFSQNILKSWSNVQKNYKNIFHHRGGQARDGKSHHVFTFFKMNLSLMTFVTKKSFFKASLTSYKYYPPFGATNIYVPSTFM